MTAVSNPKEQEIACLRVWSESAPYWDKYASVIRAMFESVSYAWIEDAALRPGASALNDLVHKMSGRHKLFGVVQEFGVIGKRAPFPSGPWRHSPFRAASCTRLTRRHER